MAIYNNFHEAHYFDKIQLFNGESATQKLYNQPDKNVSKQSCFKIPLIAPPTLNT